MYTHTFRRSSTQAPAHGYFTLGCLGWVYIPILGNRNLRLKMLAGKDFDLDSSPCGWWIYILDIYIGYIFLGLVPEYFLPSLKLPFAETPEQPSPPATE